MDSRYCRYHSDDGLKCAIGVLIDEESYFPEMDDGNRTIKYLVANYPDRFPEWMRDKNTLGLLSELQTVHDRTWNWESNENMARSLIKVAEAYGLSPMIMNGLTLFKKSDKNEENAEGSNG